MASNLETLGAASGLGTTDLLTVIGRIIQVFLGSLGVIFLILVIYAGFLWMTSQGNEEKVEKAQAIIKSAVIGLAICLAAFSITTFIMNTLLNATGNGGTSVSSARGAVEAFSDALGSGAIQDHYPGRNTTDIPRNTKIMVTFKSPMYIPSFISGYNDNSTATDVTDDTAPTTSNVVAANFQLSCVDDTSKSTTDYASTDITVTFTSDQKTFVFDPPVLGSATSTTTCTVTLGNGILDAAGAKVFSSNPGYEWSFEVSTALDTTPPTIVSIVPSDGSSDFARNITVQMTFSEAVDPTTTTGTYDAGTGFTDIQVQADPSHSGTFSPLSGTFVTSSGYTVVEFTPTDACGTNSCGTTVYCLPGPDTAKGETVESIHLAIKSATLSSSSPEAVTPYDGVVDMAGNALDGGKGPGTDSDTAFGVTSDVVTVGPQIESINPTVLDENVPVDQNVDVVWNTLMRSSTLTNSVVGLVANPEPQLWYDESVKTLDKNGDVASVSGLEPSKTEMSIAHGAFLKSVVDDPATSSDETITQLYAPILPQDIESLYQNCFYPAVGPGATTTTSCDGTTSSPYCCNGTASTTGFDSTKYTCL